MVCIMWRGGGDGAAEPVPSIPTAEVAGAESCPSVAVMDVPGARESDQVEVGAGTGPPAPSRMFEAP